MIESIVIIILLSLLVITLLLVACSNNLFVATIIAGFFSLLTAMLFSALNAPDVAFTEAAVGAGVATIFFLAVIALTGHAHTYKKENVLLSFTLASSIFVLLLYSMLDLPQYANAMTPGQTHTAAYYLTHTTADMGIPNVVTAILASYRGFDTLGELAVIFTAGIGALAIFSTRKKGTPNEND